MSSRGRLLLFLLTAPGLAGLLLWGMHQLPPCGDYRGPYGKVINAVGPDERQLANMATAINFDYRGFDTLGEEYILFTSLVGLALLLRRMRGPIEEGPREFVSRRQAGHRSDALHWLGLIALALTNLFGIYILVHAQQTPGGGFQAGTILGTASLLVYLALGYPAFRRTTPHRLAELGDALGAGAYVVIGLGTLLAGGFFLENLLPLGTRTDLFSAGTIPLINLAVGLEVAGGFCLLFVEFLKDTRKPAPEKSS